MNPLDCVVIGYNEVPFEQYMSLLGNCGKSSPAYRDIKLSFVDLNGAPRNYVDLMNMSEDGLSVAQRGGPRFVSGEIPNLAAVYLSNFLRRRGLTTRYINLFQLEKERLADWLRERPRCVAITTTFYFLNYPVTQIVQFIRSINSETRIIVGGPLISNYLRDLSGDELSFALADMGADYYVVDAQGEATLAALVSCLKRGDPPESLPNLAYFKSGELVRTPAMPELNSLDEVDIDWSAFAAEEQLGRTIQMRTARSCAFKCSFCSYPTRAGKLSLASLDTVARELESIRKIGNVQNVVFIDDTFNVPLPRFKDICRMMIERDFRFNWFSYFRCSNSDKEAFDLMARSGCKGVFLGIESGSPAILKNMNKAASVERYVEGIRCLKEREILTFASFIVGFPGETEETVNETIAFVRDHKPDFYRAQIWYSLTGTPIDLEREKYGITGQGFGWRHATMAAPEAMAHIERMFLAVKESLWLPQWSFDFWFIPYALGKGISLPDFKKFVGLANQLLVMDFDDMPEPAKRAMQRDYMEEVTSLTRSWAPQLVSA